MTLQRVPIAFYAPMKPPDDPSPSGDRQIARLTLDALGRAGFRPTTASALRTLDIQGDRDVQARLIAEAQEEADRLLSVFANRAPALWFTYHCHYKAPDLLGPRVSRELRIPYVISEPSISPRRREGPWADFAAASERAIWSAKRLFWTTRRDQPALEEAGMTPKMTHLPAFVDPGSDPPDRRESNVLRLLSVAMMRPGDKLESYRRLAAALANLPGNWRLDVIGDGSARAEVEALFGSLRGKVAFHGAIDDAARIRRIYEGADLLVWPGVGEGVGMVYLEAQAAGLPVVAEDHPAQRDIVEALLVPPDDPAAFAERITQVASDDAAPGRARQHVLTRHSLASAARILGDTLEPMLA